MNKRTLLALLLAVGIASALNLPPGVLKLQEYQQQLALSVTFFLAFLGGLLTFTSPCGFVVIPTFFSYLYKERKRALAMTALFSLGMTFAFIIFGLIAGLVGNYFNIYKEFFASISGGLLILFGILLVLNKGFSLFDFRMNKKPTDSAGVFFLGFFFAIGWTPCVGPILGGIILLAADTGHWIKGALLFGTYALGVAAPLLLVAGLSDRYDIGKWFQTKPVTFKILKHTIHTHLYGIIGGIVLIIIGSIMFLQKGTRIFMDKIPEYVPWTMSFFTDMNERLVEQSSLTGHLGNILGTLIIILLAIICWRTLRTRSNP